MDKPIDFLMLGNHPFLDFVNTRPVVDGKSVEQLVDGADLLNLLGRLDLPDTPLLRGVAASEAQEAAEDARSMREDFRELLIGLRGPEAALASHRRLETVNGWLERLGSPDLRLTSGRPEITYTGAGASTPSRWLAPLLRSGLELFTSPDFLRVRKCANPDCVLWYVDVAKSGTRRWCSMALCGNVDKARKFRQRRRSA